MDNDWKSSGHGTLSEQESRARQLFFAHVFSWCAVQFPFLYLCYWIQLSFSCCSHCSHVENLFISKMKHGFFFLFFSISKPKVYSPIPCFFSFYVPSHMHLQTRCASSKKKNYFSVLMVLIQCLFWCIHIGFFFTLFTKSVGFLSFIFPMQHSHIHTVFKHYHEQDAMIEKQKCVQCHHWLVKIGEKKQDQMEKNELCGYLQWRRHGRSGHWVRKIPANQNTGNIEGNSVFRAIVVASW